MLCLSTTMPTSLPTWSSRHNLLSPSPPHPSGAVGLNHIKPEPNLQTLILKAFGKKGFDMFRPRQPLALYVKASGLGRSCRADTAAARVTTNTCKQDNKTYIYIYGTPICIYIYGF